jgi:RNA polymerase sigma-70 factor, ECF subfamily
VSNPDTLAAEIPRLRRYARALVGNETEADDLVQDTLERALGRLHVFRTSQTPRRWLVTILHTLHQDRIQSRASHPAMTGLDETVRDPGMRPEDQITKCEVSSALQQLPLEQRKIVLLVGMEGLSYAETAEVMGIPIGTVMSRLARGRDKLRELLEHPASPAQSSPETSSPAQSSATLRRVK